MNFDRDLQVVGGLATQDRAIAGTVHIHENRSISLCYLAYIVQNSALMPDKHDEFLKLVAIRVRQLRGDESQDSVCLRAGISRRVLADIERGTRDFQITSLLRILFALDTDLPGILGVTQPEAAGRLHSTVLCQKLHDLLAMGGAIETMITTAIEQWHKRLVPVRGAAPPKHR